ncbi:hypothetical protein [Limnofasciculus baicalensis]|uniref:Uncharacterized protein n=1 Tax=Limnofasciculus baicalensis BBK-W-15 TaxID=2699891 RepID=A0AAE3KK96_9CYAN|nr:hypothetical protein [Limnofasciculus baicalensis]MCP2727335.1 hypothetical protein [Limnofasciculus baicalensis BBK-W-15]
MDSEDFFLDEPDYSDEPDWRYSQIHDFLVRIGCLATEAANDITGFRIHFPSVDYELLQKLREIEVIIKDIKGLLDTESLGTSLPNDCYPEPEEYQQIQVVKEECTTSLPQHSTKGLPSEFGDWVALLDGSILNLSIIAALARKPIGCPTPAVWPTSGENLNLDEQSYSELYRHITGKYPKKDSDEEDLPV